MCLAIRTPLLLLMKVKIKYHLSNKGASQNAWSCQTKGGQTEKNVFLLLNQNYHCSIRDLGLFHFPIHVNLPSTGNWLDHDVSESRAMGVTDATSSVNF